MGNPASFTDLLNLARGAGEDPFLLLEEPCGQITVGLGAEKTASLEELLGRQHEDSQPWLGVAPFFPARSPYAWPAWGPSGSFFFQAKRYLQLDAKNFPSTLMKRGLAKASRKDNHQGAITPEVWETLLLSALDFIETGRAEKVVLSRAQEFKLDRSPSLADVVERILAEPSPNSYRFVFSREGKIFFGLTPEKLFEQRGLRVFSDSIAGTARRGEGAAEENENSRLLLSSEKNLREHALVVDSIRTKLASLGGKLSPPRPPEIMKLAKLLHLRTPLELELAAGISPLAVLQAIHPTPALAGFPEAAAIPFLQAKEGYDRGLYAAPLGFFSTKRSLFIAGIRSALLDKDHLVAFAGAGIVQGSDPKEEWLETERKMQTILALFDK